MRQLELSGHLALRRVISLLLNELLQGCPLVHCDAVEHLQRALCDRLVHIDAVLLAGSIYLSLSRLPFNRGQRACPVPLKQILLAVFVFDLGLLWYICSHDDKRRICS